MIERLFPTPHYPVNLGLPGPLNNAKAVQLGIHEVVKVAHAHGVFVGFTAGFMLAIAIILGCAVGSMAKRKA